jgi:serine/threonine-protein kinase
VKYHPTHLHSGLRVGVWRILRRLHVGGFGAVYLVDHEGKSYALKLSLHRPDSTPGRDPACTDERTERELAALLKLKPPHVPRLLAYGRWPDAEHGYLFLVMEYVEGDLLAAWAVRRDPTLREVLRVFICLADTLVAAEARAILHRDIKPSNIVVRAKDASAVLLDWGACDLPFTPDITEGALAPGTPHYRAPESIRFAREHRDDPAARYTYQPTDDLYALGVSFYEVLTGQKPFTTPASERQRLNAEIELRIPTPPHELNPHVPAALSELVCRLLAKDPRNRPATGLALKRELESLSPESKLWDALLGLPRPASAARPASEPSPARNPRILRLGGLALAAVAMAALAYAGAELLAPAPPPAPPTPIAAPPPSDEAAPRVQAQTDAGTPPSPSPLEKEQTVTTSEPRKRRPTSREVLKTGCLVALTGLDSGCATAPIKPPTDDCPPKAVQAMQALGIERVESLERIRDVLIHINWGEDSLWQPGPVVGRVMKTHVRKGKTLFPEGTLLHGSVYIWPRSSPQEPWAVRVHYTEAQFPNGNKVPVCLAHLPTNDCTPRDGAFYCQIPHLTYVFVVPAWYDNGDRPWAPRWK